MFKNDYQGGPCFEVFSAQEKLLLKNWKLTGTGIRKLFDEDIKSYVYSLEGSAEKTRMQLPNDSKRGLSLIQSFIVLQLYIQPAQDFALDLGIMHGSSTRRRLALSTVFKELKMNEIHCQIPLGFIKRSMWISLCINMADIVAKMWPDMTFQSLDSICVSGSFRLRRIFTMKRQAPDMTSDEDWCGVDVNADVELESIPRQCQLPPNVQSQTQVVNWLKVKRFEESKMASKSRTTGATDSSTVTSGDKSTVNEPVSGSSSSSSHLAVRQMHKRSNSDITPGSSTSSASSASVTQEPSFGNENAGDESRLFVRPHPPQMPSSNKVVLRRKPRIRSAGHDRTPPTSANGLQRMFSEPPKVSIVATEEEVDKFMNELQIKTQRRHTLPSESESDVSSHAESQVATEDSDDSISEAIRALNEGRFVVDGNSSETSDSGKMYVYSSRPRAVQGQPAKPSAKKLARPTAKQSANDEDGDNEFNQTSEVGILARGVNGSGDGGGEHNKATLRIGGTIPTCSSPVRQSVVRSSLREIPADEVQRSGTMKPYHYDKYQGDELTDSFEREMLLEMQKEAAEDGEDVEGDNFGDTKKNSDKYEDVRLNAHLCVNTILDSSDDETSTLKSPIKYQPHNYMDEMANLQRNFMRTSLPSEMDSTYSPRFDSPYASFDTINTMELPTLSTRREPEQVQRPSKTIDVEATEAVLELMYDPELDVFYDPRTLKYYKLKTPYDNPRR